jgi:hypothetical protein
MRRIVLIVCVTLIFVVEAAHAAFERTPGDARSGALAGAGVGWVADTPSPFGNPAQLARLTEFPVCVSRADLYGIQSLGWSAAWGGVRLGRGAVGGGVAQLGGKDYRETTLAASLGFRWGSTAWGGTVRFLNLGITGLPSARSVVLDAGVLESITDRISVGLQLGGVGPGGDRFGRPRVQLGCGYRGGSGLSVMFDVEQIACRRRRIRVGVETRLAPELVLRAGRVSEPGEISGGVGIRRGSIGVDVSVHWHAVLGFSERVTVKIGRDKGSQ